MSRIGIAFSHDTDPSIPLNQYPTGRQSKSNWKVTTSKQRLFLKMAILGVT